MRTAIAAVLSTICLAAAGCWTGASGGELDAAPGGGTDPNDTDSSTDGDGGPCANVELIWQMQNPDGDELVAFAAIPGTLDLLARTRFSVHRIGYDGQAVQLFAGDAESHPEVSPAGDLWGVVSEPWQGEPGTFSIHDLDLGQISSFEIHTPGAEAGTEVLVAFVPGTEHLLATDFVMDNEDPHTAELHVLSFTGDLVHSFGEASSYDTYGTSRISADGSALVLRYEEELLGCALPGGEALWSAAIFPYQLEVSRDGSRAIIVSCPDGQNLLSVLEEGEAIGQIDLGQTYWSEIAISPSGEWAAAIHDRSLLLLREGSQVLDEEQPCDILTGIDVSDSGETISWRRSSTGPSRVALLSAEGSPLALIEIDQSDLPSIHAGLRTGFAIDGDHFLVTALDRLMLFEITGRDPECADAYDARALR